MSSPDYQEHSYLLQSSFSVGKISYDTELSMIRREIAMLGELDDPTISRLLNRVHNPWSQRVLESIQSNPVRTTTGFAQLREDFISQGVGLPSRPNLCARIVISNVVTPKFQSARTSYDGGNFVPMIVHYDIADGIRMSVSGIFTAESYMTGRVDDDGIEAVQKSADMFEQVSEVEYAEGYLVHQRTAARAAELLQRDPTGQLLVEDRINQILEESKDPELAKQNDHGGWIYPWQISEFVAAGAEFGGKLYKLLLPYVIR